MTSNNPEFDLLLPRFIAFLDCDAKDFDWPVFIHLLDRIFPTTCGFARDMSNLPQHLHPWGNSQEDYPWVPVTGTVPPRADNDNMPHQLPESQILPGSAVEIPISHVRTSDKPPADSECTKSQSNNPIDEPQPQSTSLDTPAPPPGDSAERSSWGVPFLNRHENHSVLPLPTSSTQVLSPAPVYYQLPPINPQPPANPSTVYPGATPGRQAFPPAPLSSSGHTRTGSEASLFHSGSAPRHVQAMSVVSTTSSSEPPPPTTPSVLSTSGSMGGPKISTAFSPTCSYQSYPQGSSTVPIWTAPMRAPSPPVHNVVLQRRSPQPLALASADLALGPGTAVMAPVVFGTSSVSQSDNNLYQDEVFLAGPNRQRVTGTNLTFSAGTEPYVSLEERNTKRVNWHLWEDVSMVGFFWHPGSLEEWLYQALLPGQSDTNYQRVFERLADIVLEV
ncbi:hypothetical protein FRC08_003006 [Ceratobasidium sp. 394]|nr:hypothetical protein FRC08_003006 [Ceratobasidium sp. 394]